MGQLAGNGVRFGSALDMVAPVNASNRSLSPYSLSRTAHGGRTLSVAPRSASAALHPTPPLHRRRSRSSRQGGRRTSHDASAINRHRGAEAGTSTRRSQRRTFRPRQVSPRAPREISAQLALATPYRLARHHRNLMATVVDSRDFLQATRRAETQVLLPPGPKVALAGGVDCNDHHAIWAASTGCKRSMPPWCSFMAAHPRAPN